MKNDTKRFLRYGKSTNKNIIPGATILRNTEYLDKQ